MGSSEPGSPPPIVLASTSPQRSAILTQLGIPFEAVTPAYEESPGGDPLEHAAGKALSVEADGRTVLGVDTVVMSGEAQLGKPSGETEARSMLERLSGRTHEVVSGLCLLGSGWEELATETTRVIFRELTDRDIDTYLRAGEWRGRAGGYAIQGLGAALVESVDGDYLNVVGLPASLLVAALARRCPGLYGFG
jgi:septum formation protein